MFIRMNHWQHSNWYQAYITYLEQTGSVDSLIQPLPPVISQHLDIIQTTIIRSGTWSQDEDTKLKELVKDKKDIMSVTQIDINSFLLKRTLKQARERWRSHLDPLIRHGN